MNSELAKELRDAGFPMKKLKDWNMVECPFPWGHFKHGEESFIFPALSELIDACKFFTWRFSLEQHSNDWRAGIYEGKKQFSSGKTPEEAVARFWLSLKANQ